MAGSRARPSSPAGVRAALAAAPLWAGPVVLGLVCAAVYVTTGSAALRSMSILLVAVVAVASILAGASLHAPAQRLFWRLMALGSGLFVIGALVRPWAVTQPGVLAAAADLFTLAGYLACVGGLLGIAGPHARSNTFAMLDGLVAVVGCACVVVIFLGLPAAGVDGRPLWVSVLAGLYPMLDIAVVFVILQLGFTSAGGTVSFRALTGSLLFFLVGDVGYAWIGVRGQLVGSPLLDLPYFGAYTLFAVAALHPTMTQLTSAVPRPAQAWSRRRLALLVPALCLPSITVLLSPAQTLTARAVEAAAGLVVAVLVVRRALSAVERHVAAQQTLLHQSTHDGLTGMLNRVAATDELDRIAGGASAGGGAVWAAVLDLDHFRLVNDTWGSAVGDRLLSAMAARLATVATEHACPLVARQGGDEFVFAGAAPSPGAATRSVLRLAAALRETAAQPVLVDELEFVVSVSIGAAVGPGQTSAVGLLRNADTALGRAKFEGRDRCVLYDEAMSAVVAKRLRLGTALRRAIELEELEVFYQPIVRIDGGRVQGCEALLRWTLKGEGPVSPAEFIPVAEESGLVVELGAWVLEQAAATTMQWRRSGVVDNDFSVSVNVSARQLVEGDFVATVRDVLERTGLPARCLVLEITESVMLTDPDTSIALLEELRRGGVRLSLDDFGTGYSSLSHLDRLPVHTVKLDRSFVAALDAPNGNAAIVRAVQGIAEALGLSVVAEGVETPAQHSTLRALRIGLGQGWLWGPAVSASDFASRWSVSAGNTITARAAAGSTGTVRPWPDGWGTS
ncbi:bifunctional diguanylate cyclase/phosphodiesterase [Kineosporia sp. R_H_3]|uniref:putative bifunctional diguanylate cyclase/phosphodiesterase n=1 Tax=Kineosporia sp. R_H_3 TaxID=1961848 RepID=UPI000B4BE46A|nr:bifunctional diguanylate cyclase/phosphodiesterase [Kineosporia sp. R_H_3]